MDESKTAWEQLISRIDRNMPVEVMRDFDMVLLFGRLDTVSEKEMTIRRASNDQCFPVMEEGGVVLVRCYDMRRAPILLRARVTRASGLMCRVGELEWIPYRTQRKGARYPLCPPASACVVEELDPESAWPCQLVNVSARGACIVAQRAYTVGQSLCLRIGPENAGGCAAYSCQVARATPRGNGSFEYGLSFGHLSGEQREGLLEALHRQRRTGFDIPGGALDE